TGDEFFAGVARDIVRWMDEWLSDRAHGGFYASQDADYSMDDDGDYFTWTLAETKAALAEDEAAVATLYYDIEEAGDMHHNPAKNVLHIQNSTEQIARRLNIPEARAGALLTAAQKKMYAARLLRPTPYVDKTVYAGWNAMCVSAYLKAAKVLDLAPARHFALRSLDRLLSEGWNAERGMRHVIAYSETLSDMRAEQCEISGVLDDYAFADVPGVNLDNQRKGFWGLLHNWGRFDLRGWGDEPGRVEQALAHDLGALSLPLGFAGQSAPAQRAPGHAQAKRLRLLGGHLGNEQGAHLLHQGRGGRVVPQPQHPVDGKNPLPAMGAPAMGAEQFDFAAIGINPPGHATLLVAQRPQAIGALFIGLVGLGLHGFLHEQPGAG